jgi:hypothetical protein
VSELYRLSYSFAYTYTRNLIFTKATRTQYYVQSSDIEFHIKSENVYRPFATTVSHLKICDFSGQTFKGFEVL